MSHPFRVDPFKVADELIGCRYRVPVPERVRPAPGGSFMPMQPGNVIDLGELLFMLQRSHVALQDKLAIAREALEDVSDECIASEARQVPWNQQQFDKTLEAVGNCARQALEKIRGTVDDSERRRSEEEEKTW